MNIDAILNRIRSIPGVHTAAEVALVEYIDVLLAQIKDLKAECSELKREMNEP